MTLTALLPGTPVRLVNDVDRYPHFIAGAGMTGRVTVNDGETFCVRMDQHLPGAEDWDNEIVWSVYDGDNPMRDIAYAPDLEPNVDPA